MTYWGVTGERFQKRTDVRRASATYREAALVLSCCNGETFTAELHCFEIPVVGIEMMLR